MSHDLLRELLARSPVDSTAVIAALRETAWEAKAATWCGDDAPDLDPTGLFARPAP